MLSRLDGSLTVGELCKISGLGREQTLAALEALAKAGAIEVPGLDVEPISEPEEAPPEQRSDAQASATGAASSQNTASPSAGDESSAPKETEPADQKSTSGGKKKRRVTPNYPVPPEEFDVEERLLEVDVPLDEERRREVVCLHEQLSDMSFYDLFGLQPDAGRKEIKKAYFRMSKRYHPDKFFRKEMDDFGPMVETIFKEITKAYRTLSNKRKREEYDGELDAQSAQPAAQRAEEASRGSDEEQANLAQNEGLSESSTPKEQNKRKAAAVLLMRRAETLKERGEYDKAAGEYRKALALNRDAQIALRVARLFVEQAKMGEEAASFARAAIELGADEAQARFLLGRAYEMMESPKAAAEEYRQVLEVQPGHDTARARLEELSVET